MPNWCNNNISIVGNIETIKQLWEDANQEGEAGGLLNAMYPMPERLRNTVKGSNGDAENWYDWAVSNWGTKWDVSTEGLEFEDHGDGTASIQGWFESAWAPPIGAYEKFCDMMDGVDLEASYHEPGMDFAGFWTAAGGDEYLEGCYEEFKLPEDERSDLYNRLDEEFNLSENYDMWEEEEDE